MEMPLPELRESLWFRCSLRDTGSQSPKSVGRVTLLSLSLMEAHVFANPTPEVEDCEF